jgi:hypothetical protein
VTQLQRRDFLLDSGAVGDLARDRKALDALWVVLRNKYIGSIRVPDPVLSEVYTGDPRLDVVVDRLLNEIDTGDKVFEPLNTALAKRAGVLRYQALKRNPGEEISPTDAQLVAIAEYRSHSCFITIVTGDVEHIRMLLECADNAKIDVARPR